MNIKVTRDDAKVQLGVAGEFPIGNFNFPFTCSCGHEWWAKLLEENIRAAIENRLEAIRRVAYDMGYRDGRAKQRKKTAFYTDFSTNVA